MTQVETSSLIQDLDKVVEMVADMVADMMADMAFNMEVYKVVDNEANIVVNMVFFDWGIS